MTPYLWLSFADAKAQLAARLADPGMAQWVDAELGLYIRESLRMWNALTATWTGDCAAAASPGWNRLDTLPGTPRARTVTDTDAYTLLEYHLLEPPTGGTWTGTSQFAIADLAGALGRVRGEMLLEARANMAALLLPSAVNTRRVNLPDEVLELSRVVFVPADYPRVTLVRDDELAYEYFQPSVYQNQPSLPASWLAGSEPPLSFTVDTAPGVAGVYAVLAQQAAPPFTPPTPTLLGVPDDFAWVARWGALADLLGRESEATDRQRAQWCAARYTEGLKLLAGAPWLLRASLNGVAVNVERIKALDRFQPEWDATGTFADGMVTDGIDFFWAPAYDSVGLTVVANAPVPEADADFVQVSRAAWEACLNMAQVLATFKLGGAEFAEAQGLEEAFTRAAAAEGDRLAKLGLLRDVVDTRAAGPREGKRLGER